MLVIPLVAGVICATLVASAVAPDIACARPALHEDRRVAADRVDSARNPGRGDESFLYPSITNITRVECTEYLSFKFWN